MPLNSYGVLKGKVIQGIPAPRTNDSTPHYHAVVEAAGKEYELAINVKSKKKPSELIYLVSEDFNSEQITHLPNLKEGFTKINESNREIALDYIRGGLFEPSKMIELAYDIEGPNNDLNEKVDEYLHRAIDKENAKIYVYGEPFPSGMHNIHMNQGNHKDFKKDDGIWQDGGIVIHLEDENKWLGMFLAFQSQSWCTDDAGHVERPVSQCSHKTVKVTEVSR
ncbi:MULTISPECIES: YukJ family protein [Paenibacillus]|uniref:YukJ family protein n=1 Tax=Paenibacillus TaxID=44249 RepID=UPI000C9EEF2F|nr:MULTISPECIES: YukJ family protein [Paenibacillus]PNQ81344.1 DUF2278 domain-containing protein [Paenibacillus sp. F4]WCM63160.1 YukJ family protein [Paenibacillus polymyxa]